jgi:heat shock protein HslJ
MGHHCRHWASVAVTGAIAVVISLDGITQTAVPGVDELANATYSGIYDHPVTLNEGRWEGEPFVPDGASRPSVGLVKDFLISGDLDGDGSDESVVLLWANSGGSGTYNYVAAVKRYDGKIGNAATAPLGDRVQVRAGRITSGQIQLDVVQQGPDDAACCPSQTATRRWTLVAGNLSEDTPAMIGTLSLADFSGPEWVLSSLERDAPAPTQPEVTLAFEGNRVSGKSGCNRYFGSVKVGEMPGAISMGPIGGTRMACPNTIMAIEDHYLEALGNVTSYSFLAGKLALTWEKGGVTHTMLFIPRAANSEN